MNKINKISGEEMLQEYIKLGAYMKMLRSIAFKSNSEIYGYFGKTNKLSKNMQKIFNEIEQLRSDLEDSMPYYKITEECKKAGIQPIEIFYGRLEFCELNKKQQQFIFDKFLNNSKNEEEPKC